MRIQENLRCQTVSLKSGEEWSQKRNGLAVLLIQSEGGSFVCGKVIRALRAGDLVILGGPASATVQVHGAESRLEARGFSVDLEQLYPLLGVAEIAKLLPLAERLQSGRVYLAGSGIAEECKEIVDQVPKSHPIRERSEMLRVAAHVLHEEFKGTVGPRHYLESHIARTLESLTQDELISLSLDELAVRFSCTRRHLNRIFHQAFGASVVGLRMEMRLLKATSLLRQRRMKMVDVAEHCGFNHLSLFNRCFRHRFGMNPTEWRKQHEEQSNGASEADPGCPLLRQGLCMWGHEARGGNGNGNGKGNGNGRTHSIPCEPQHAALPALPATVGLRGGDPLRATGTGASI